jgi:hypothetical protein
MRIVLATILAACLSANEAQASAGFGSYHPTRGNILRAARAPPLDRLGDDVARFSSTPALGGRGWVIELHRAGSARATGEVIYFGGHPSRGWRKLGWMKLELPAAQFAEVTAKIDGQLARGEPSSESIVEGQVAISVCTDGPGYVSERRTHGRSMWLEGFCGDHPNNEIARLLIDVVRMNDRKWLPDRNLDIKAPAN